MPSFMGTRESGLILHPLRRNAVFQREAQALFILRSHFSDNACFVCVFDVIFAECYLVRDIVTR